MISYLKGRVINKVPGEITLLVNNVGYRVLISDRTLKSLPVQPQLISLYIYTHVREDTICLFGFPSIRDKRIFSLLISVSGIGPKIALAILSVAKAKNIQQAVAKADVDFFNKISGIGKKSAQRIIIDLKSKFASLGELDLTKKPTAQYPQVNQALKSLGFSAEETKIAINRVKNKSKLETADIIRQALKNLK